MTTSDNNKKELNEFINQFSQRPHRVVWKNRKAYDRARDRKDKKLFEVDEEKNELEQES
nr:MAG TPA: hypothetical protein [Caudoviricetes sp.]